MLCQHKPFYCSAFVKNCCITYIYGVAPVVYTSLLSQVQNQEGHFSPTPTLQTSSELTYMSYLELKWKKSDKRSPDLHCPSLNESNTFRCESCRHLLFLSNAALERHTKYCHISSTLTHKRKSEHICTYKDCGLHFGSYYKLNKHKKEKGHLLKRGRQTKQ